MNHLLLVATLVSALGCGLMAGLFFAFSTSVMNALARRPPAEGMAAMQAINVATREHQVFYPLSRLYDSMMAPPRVC